MRHKTRKRYEKGTLELIEEAVHLLRLSPARTLAVYCIGTLPFVAALLYFSIRRRLTVTQD